MGTEEAGPACPPRPGVWWPRGQCWLPLPSPSFRESGAGMAGPEAKPTASWHAGRPAEGRENPAAGRDGARGLPPPGRSGCPRPPTAGRAEPHSQESPRRRPWRRRGRDPSPGALCLLPLAPGRAPARAGGSPQRVGLPGRAGGWGPHQLGGGECLPPPGRRRGPIRREVGCSWQVGLTQAPGR